MTKDSFPPPTLGRYLPRYLAVRFGAPDDDQSLSGVPLLADRARYSARLDFERERINIWHAFKMRDFGSPDGKPESLPAITRAAAHAYILAEDAKFDAGYRKALQFPAIVRNEGPEGLLSPFAADDDEKKPPLAFGSRVLPVPRGIKVVGPSAAAVARTRQKFSRLPRFRVAFLCLHHGAADETPEGVPANRSAAFAVHREYHEQARMKLFEEICAEHGSRSGLFEDIPASSQAVALRALEREAADFENACRFELEIKKIALSEAESESRDESDLAFG